MTFLWVLSAFLLFVLGVLLLPLPLPVGLPFIIIALGILLKKSMLTKKIMRSLRRRSVWFNRLLLKLENNLPRMAASLLRRTRPFQQKNKSDL